jgi:hypothetical protein
VSWLNVSVKTIFNILKIRRNAPDCFYWKQESPVMAMFANGLGRNEQSL